MPVADQLLRVVDSYRRWILASAAILLLASFTPNWRITPDAALFLGVARNLAEGRGFTFNEQPVTTVNAGFPYLLALTRSLSTDPFVAGNAMVLAFGFASLVLVYLLVLRQAGRGLAVLVTLLTAVNGTFLRHSCEILADVPFFFCCTLALLGYELTFARPSSAQHEPKAAAANPALSGATIAMGAALVLAGLAGMASLRIVFLGPLVAILIDLLWRVRRSRFKWAVLSAAAAALLVALAIRLADPRMAGGFVLLTKERQMLDMLLDLPARIPHIISTNAPRLFFDSTPRAILGNKVGFWPVDLAISLAVLASAALLLRRRLAWAALVAIYFVQWLVLYPDPRYFLPVLPLLLLGWWDLAILLTDRAPVRWKRAVLFALLALLFVPNLIRSIGFAIEQHHQPFLARYLRGRFQDLESLSTQARLKLPPDAVIITGEQFGNALHYFSGLRTTSTTGPMLLSPVPPDRPVFALLPADPGFDSVLRTLRLAPQAPVLSGPDRVGETLTIVPLR
jgi:hypothetical protein